MCICFSAEALPAAQRYAAEPSSKIDSFLGDLTIGSSGGLNGRFLCALVWKWNMACEKQTYRDYKLR
jgi:hypothetical protein